MKNKYLFLILFCLNLLNYIDRQVLYAVFPLVQTDLHLTDFQLGLTASVFMFVYMCYAPLIGYWADRTSRPKLISISALLWGIATLLSATATHFRMLITARGLIGVGEGGFTTMAQPFLAEHYPKEKHASVLALFGLALPLGSAVGYIAGGIIGANWGWRIAFMLAGVPSVFLALLAWYLPDNARQIQNTPKPTLKEYTHLFKNKPFLYVCIAQAMITFLIGGCSAWVPTYFVRYLKLDVAQAGTYFGILVILGGTIGTYLGGVWAQRWKTKNQNAYYNMLLVGLIGCIVPIWLGLFLQNIWGALVCFWGAIILLFLPTGAIAAALVETTPSKMHAMAFAVNIFIIHLLGDALSPSIIGALADVWNLKTALLSSTAVVGIGIWASCSACKKTLAK